MLCSFSTDGDYSCSNINEQFDNTTTNNLFTSDHDYSSLLVEKDLLLYDYSSLIVNSDTLLQVLSKNYNDSKIPYTTLLDQYQQQS